MAMAMALRDVGCLPRLPLLFLLLFSRRVACTGEDPRTAAVRQRVPQQHQHGDSHHEAINHDHRNLLPAHLQRCGRGKHEENEGIGAAVNGRGNGSRRESDLGSSCHVGNAALDSEAEEASQRVLILDVDGTLYGWSAGVEQQIIEGVHRFLGEELGLSPVECDQLHRLHGSTVWGLQREGRLSKEQVERYFREVFSSISLRGLRGVCEAGASPSSTTPLPPTVCKGEGERGYECGDDTGFSHRASAAAMIRAHNGPIFLASNSPSQHVRRVLEALGLADVSFAGILTPDTRGWLTKSSPEFYDPILEHDDVRHLGRGELWLLDDSPVNLEVASQLGLRTLRVDGDKGKGEAERPGDPSLGLDRAVACFVGAIPHPDDWQFSESEYLRRKNDVDRESRSEDVWRRLVKEASALDLGERGILRVADLGCGLLPLLEDFRFLAKACGARKLEYCGLEKEIGVAMEACQGLLRKGYTLTEDLEMNHVPPEGNAVSRDKTGRRERRAWHLRMVKHESSSDSPMDTTVLLTTENFVSVDPADLFPSPIDPRDEHASGAVEKPQGRERLHVIVGCCLADLLSPSALLGALKRLAGGGAGDCLVYLPITFAGKTEAIPAAPQEDRVPSDASLLAAYDACLREEQGHHTCVDSLLKTIREHGGKIIASSPSPWRVSREAHPYTWQCLMFFIGLGVAPRPPPLDAGNATAADEAVAMEEAPRADLAGWVRRARERSPTLVARNVDLLFRLGEATRGGANETGNRVRNASSKGTLVGAVGSAGQRSSEARRALSSVIGGVSHGGGAAGASPGGKERTSSPPIPPPSSSRRENTFLEFVAPGKVEVRQEDMTEVEALAEGQVLVEALCSSISSGTELKVFQGDFDTNSELDTTIKGMAGETMSYPLRYGYSMVGRVARCGGGVDAAKLLGKLVFTFSPHASWVIADAAGVMLVPEGIAAEDAVYLPAVETALSLVHEVHPRVGESVAVFGQGMIGLLTVSILAKTHGEVGGGRVVAVDVLQDRLKVAKRLGASAAVAPEEAGGLAPFDVSLEVTGNPKALQSALDLTGYGGRVILGSWYGGGVVQLNLGTAFHRSHLTLQASQVSRLPAGITDRWDKDRRFAAAWSLVRELRPSRFLTTRSTSLQGAQEAFESLDAGSELGVVFQYN